MLSLTQLTINALSNLDLQKFIEKFNEISGAFFQGVLDSEINFEHNVIEGIVEKSPIQNIDHNIPKKPIHSHDNDDFSVSEILRIMCQITQLSDFLLQRIENAGVKSICGHRRHDILANKQLSDEIASILNNKINKLQINKTNLSTQKRPPTDNFMRGPDVGCRNGSDNGPKNEYGAKKNSPSTDSTVPPHPLPTGGTIYDDRSQPERTFGTNEPEPMLKLEFFKTKFIISEAIFPVIEPTGIWCNFVNQKPLTTLYFVAQEPNWKKRKRKMNTHYFLSPTAFQ